MPTPTIGLPPTRTNNMIDRAFAAIHDRLDALEQGGGGGGAEVTSVNFTPQVFGTTGQFAMSETDNFAQSTRLGDLVIVQGKFTVEGAGTASGAFRVGGFPVAPYFDAGLSDLSPDDESALFGLFAWVAPENGFELSLGASDVLTAGAVPIISVSFVQPTVSASPGDGYTDIGGGLYVGCGISMQAEANAGDSGGTVSASNCEALGFFGQTMRFVCIYRAE